MSAFLFVHFRYGEPEIEQVHFAISQDGCHWEALHGGKPVLAQNDGEKGVRDPFIYRKPDGTFIVLATDLSIMQNRNRTWHDVATRGSRALVVWESPDLVNWSAPRKWTLNLPGSGCAWAPEVFFDETCNRPLLIWSAKVGDEKFRVYAAYTDDFIHMDEPFVFDEEPMDVIDTHLMMSDGVYYRFPSSQFHKMVHMEKAPTLRGPWSAVTGYNLLHLNSLEAPMTYQLADGRRCLLLDYFGPDADRRGYNVFLTTDPATGQFTEATRSEYTMPYPMKHGGVMPITDIEYERLKQSYPND